MDSAEDADFTIVVDVPEHPDSTIVVEMPEELTETDRCNQQRFQQFLEGEEERRRNTRRQQAKDRLGHRYMRGG